MIRRLLLLSVLCLLAASFGIRRAAPAHADVYGYSGWATYYGIEDGVRPGDVMYDGTPYDPTDPTITSGSRLFAIHQWLLVCSVAACIPVQVRDRGYLDEFGVLLDLGRGAYQRLFGGIGGRQWVSAYFIDQGIAAARLGTLSVPPPGAAAIPAPGPAGSTSSAELPRPAAPTLPKPGKMHWQEERRPPP